MTILHVHVTAAGPCHSSSSTSFIENLTIYKIHVSQSTKLKYKYSLVLYTIVTTKKYISTVVPRYAKNNNTMSGITNFVTSCIVLIVEFYKSHR